MDALRPIAEDVLEAKQAVTSLLKQVGWDVADMGESTAARANSRHIATPCAAILQHSNCYCYCYCALDDCDNEMQTESVPAQKWLTLSGLTIIITSNALVSAKTCCMCLI